MKKLLVTIVLTLAVVLAGTPTVVFADKPDGKGKPAQQAKGHQKPEADYQTGGPDDSANTGKKSDANNNDDNNSNGHQGNEWVVEEGSRAHNCDANGGHCVTPTPEAPPTEPEITPNPGTSMTPTPAPTVTPVDSSTGPVPTQEGPTPATLITTEPATNTLSLPDDAGGCYDCDPCELLEQILAEEQKQTQLLEEQNGLLQKIYNLLLSVLP